MKRLFFTFLAFLLIHTSGFTQVLDAELLNDLKARSIGPAGMSGRVTAIAVEPGDKNVFYGRNCLRGYLETTNGGVNFSPIFDEEQLQVLVTSN